MRAWRSVDRFEGRAAVQLVALPHRHQRLPRRCCGAAGAGRCRWTWSGPRRAGVRPGVARPEATWIQPMPDARVRRPPVRRSRRRGPAEVAVERESIRLAFVAALQHLPARQRAVLILRDVLRWRASRGRRAARHDRGVGEQRAAAGPGALARGAGRRPIRRRRRRRSTTRRRRHRALLERYVDAFERFDVDRLVALLHEDVTLAMPPYDLWLRGLDAVLGWAATSRRAAAGDGPLRPGRHGQRRPDLRPLQGRRRRLRPVRAPCRGGGRGSGAGGAGAPRPGARPAVRPAGPPVARCSLDDRAAVGGADGTGRRRLAESLCCRFVTNR